MTHWLLAWQKLWRGDDEGAIRDAEAALRLVPYDILSRADLGHVLAAAGQLNEATELTKWAARNEAPEGWQGAMELAWTDYLAGRYREAAAAMDRWRPWAPQLHAVVLVRNGRLAEAREVIAGYLAAHPERATRFDGEWMSIEPFHKRWLDDLRQAGMP